MKTPLRDDERQALRQLAPIEHAPPGEAWKHAAADACEAQGDAIGYAVESVEAIVGTLDALEELAVAGVLVILNRKRAFLYKHAAIIRQM